MKKTKQIKSVQRIISFFLCFLLTSQSLSGYGTLTANASSVIDAESSVITDITSVQSEALPSDTLDNQTTTTDAAVATTDTLLETPQEKTVDLNSEFFPDENFLSYIQETLDLNQDNVLSEEEINSVTILDVSNLGICSLQGIEYFINLEELDCSNNQISFLNLDTFSNLTKLDCSFNHLYSLDTTTNKNLSLLTAIGNATAIQLDENNSFDLSALADFNIAKTVDWSCDYTLEDNRITFPDSLDSTRITYSVSTIETAASQTPIVFTFVLYKEILLDVSINEINFPDSVLRDILLSYDENKDGLLNSEELCNITSMDISDYDLKDFTGFTYFKNLAYLNYSNTQSLSLDLSVLPESVLRYCDSELVAVESESTETTHSDMTAQLEESQDIVSDTTTATSQETTSIDSSAIDSSTDSSTVDIQPAGITVNPNTVKKKVTYNITYVLDNGTLPSDVVTTFMQGESVSFPTPTRIEYQFDGWFLDSNFTTSTTAVSADTASDVTVYAKWTQLFVNTSTEITDLTRSGNGKLVVAYQAMEGVAGYEIICSTSKNFKNNIRTTSSSKTKVTVKSLLKNKTYYVKVRGYITDSAGEKVYGEYSATKKIKVKSGVTEANATSTSAKINSCKITNTDTVTVKGKTSNIIKSSDSYYYLFSVPSTQTNLKKLKPVATTEKATSFTFTAALDQNGDNNLLQSKFVIAIKQKSSYKIISSFQYLSNPEGAASYTYDFPTAPTKKGLQGYSSSLGINHTVLNIEVNDLIATESEYGDASTDEYTYKGKTYYFRRDVANQYAYTAKEFSEDGAVVYAILLLSWSSKNHLIAPGAREYGYAYYAWNMKEKSAKEQLEATITYFAEYCCEVTKDGPGIAGWIVGNEVDNFDTWNYAGTSNLNSYAKIYADTFRLVYNATKSVYSNARIYVSLDHMWAMSNEGTFGSKAFLEKFNSILESEGNIDWDVAYHPYPVPLTEPDFWNNEYISNNENTDVINIKNLSVLTNYLKKHYGKDKRVILSEVGFTSTKGEKVQAAAIAYAYYVAEFNPMVDAFIMRSLHDAEVEVEQGLNFGITNKYAYNVYKYMDTPNSEKYTKFALKVIGAKSWKSIVPKYKAKKFKSMPNRE